MSREATLKLAELALAKGAYKECLSTLESLLEGNSFQKDNDAQVAILMITALIGKGDNQRAIAISEILTKHSNHSIRQQAKQFLSILKSPSLERPSDWSVTIPKLNLDTPLTGVKAFSNTNSKPDNINPPTGPTKHLKAGFTILSLVFFLLLSIFLSGCVKFTTKIEMKGADHMTMNWDIESNSNRLLPWQEDFQSSLKKLQPRLEIETYEDGKQRVSSPVLSSRDANTLFKDTIAIAAELSDFQVPKSNLNLVEKNWLIGIEQHLNLDIDLRQLPEIPGLNLTISIKSASSKTLPKSQPIAVTLENNYIKWILQQGSMNTLSLVQWHWSQLGIGTIVIILIMILSIIIQNLRLQLGFGFPELPP
ncbi:MULTISPECIES: DUF3153 domain-containing protein [unclassified Prochlorococcus]|uniref:DUF3153 domain-containing protein n=1 Tax=unclassified Prochlorococcus TaxID=2627481 RepID=UPI000533838C|nr:MULTISPECIES: DUF3153 domain-containing protein [unclassified Prochlorococcus]KGG16461.1 hypothetical protein EV06_0298 [Prochlorococcus sp. MIT 0602]KGG17065.1 hypothetical protein EV07_0496 [Prochlorococcus sp. MIT 0603]